MKPEQAVVATKVIQQLERARATKRRVRIFYGDTNTGRDYLEYQETVGYVVRPLGTQVLHLRRRRDSDVGGEILTNQIVRLMMKPPGKNSPFEEVYRHPAYHVPSLQVVSARSAVFNSAVSVSEDAYAVCVNGRLALDAFPTEEKAELFIKFLCGERAVR